MTYESRSPHIVQRAAARMAGAMHSPAESASAVARASEWPSAHVNAHRRVVNISPTSLAGNGVALDPAANGRTTEEFRIVKRQVLANASKSVAGGAHLGRTVLITSAKPGDGKTFTAINLALSLAAERDLKVLLVDADVYRQSLLKYLGISADLGWVDYLTRGDLAFNEVLLHTNVPNLSVLPAGQAHGEIPELMSSRNMAAFVEELARRYDDRFIVFDALPCLASSEPAILASLVGQALFVVSANQTSREELESSLRLIDACPNVSLVLNKAEPLLNQEFGKYSYGYDYRS